LNIGRVALALFLLLAPAASLAASGRKVTIKGTLVDMACAAERVNDLDSLRSKHTRKCLQMPACDKSGFGVLTEDDRVLRFDAAGNDRARALIAGTQRDKQLLVKVSGRLDGETLVVRKLALRP